MAQVIKLIVGLGNPGPQYQNTRHNVGAWVIQALADQFQTPLKLETKFKGYYCSVMFADTECKLLFPTTYMNESGQAVLALTKFYKIPVEEILIAHDELDFLPGQIRLKKGGSANGHNGVQNIIDQLGSNEFYRLRIGIGRPSFKGAMVDYVLNKPTLAERAAIVSAINLALTVMPELIAGNMSQVMQVLHSNVTD